MAETLTFHFEGALADSHQMNFYEAARFQYAAARLMVKLAQFRQKGRFTKKITNNSNINIRLSSLKSGSFNINIEDIEQDKKDPNQFNMSLSDLFAYVGERIVPKLEDNSFSPSTFIGGSQTLTRDGRIAIETLSLSDLVRESGEDSSLYLPTGSREATGSEHGRPRFNEGLRGLTKADSLVA